MSIINRFVSFRFVFLKLLLLFSSLLGHAGVVTTLAGGGGSNLAGYVNGAGTVAKFNIPMSIAIDSANNVLVADFSNHLIRIITSAGTVHYQFPLSNEPFLASNDLCLNLQV